MSDLTPETRSLLDAARDAHDPPLGARARVHARMNAQLARPLATKPPPSMKWFQGGLVKVVGVGAVVAGLGAGLVAARRHANAPHAAPATAVARRAPAATSPPVAQSASPDPLPRTSPPTPLSLSGEGEPALVSQGSAPPSPDRERGVRGVRSGRAVRARDDDGGVDLTAEIALMREAQGALERNDHAGALRLAEQHRARFPQGTLQEDAAAVRVLALCRAGRAEEGRAEEERFHARWPRSLHAARVRSVCHHDEGALQIP